MILDESKSDSDLEKRISNNFEDNKDTHDMNNYLLKQLHLERKANEKNKIKKNSKISKNKSKNVDNMVHSGDEDFDSILNEAMKESNYCFHKCGIKVDLIGSNCSYCKNRFCLKYNVYIFLTILI